MTNENKKYSSYTEAREKMQAIMQERNLTNEDVASLIGIKPKFITVFMKDKTFLIGRSSVFKIYNFLGLNYYPEIMNGKTKEKRKAKTKTEKTELSQAQIKQKKRLDLEEQLQSKRERDYYDF